MAPPNEPLLLYLYTFSPYGRKIAEYLTLRQIPYKIIQQAPVPPRPDLTTLGVHYRRIPVLSIGRDIYEDTSLILSKLETLYPASSSHPSLSGRTGPERALESLLEKWTSEIVFQKSLWCLPPDLPALQNEAFTKDRGMIWGGEWGPERQKQLRPQGLVYMEEALGYLEELVGDGRKFVLGTDEPMLADLHALWDFHWLLELVPGALPEEFASRYPKAYAWRERYFEALKAGAAKMKDVSEIDGAEAKSIISNAGYVEPDGQLDSNDAVVQAQGLKKGSMVSVFPEDIGPSGEENKETGELVALNRREIVVQTKMEDGSAEVRIHAPRFNYKAQAA